MGSRESRKLRIEHHPLRKLSPIRLLIVLVVEPDQLGPVSAAALLLNLVRARTAGVDVDSDTLGSVKGDSFLLIVDRDGAVLDGHSSRWMGEVARVRGRVGERGGLKVRREQLEGRR